jgi:hypothetical protein
MCKVGPEEQQDERRRIFGSCNYSEAKTLVQQTAYPFMENLPND